MMNYCTIPQKSAYAAYTDMGRDYVVCPTPRRAGLCASATSPSGWFMSHQADICDTNATNELLDIILSKGDDHNIEHSYTHILSSPPFFCGSPPSRVSNPLIQDARFVEQKHHDFMTCSTHLKHPTISVLHSGFSSTSQKGGFASASFGSSPAVRVEGFEPLSKDRRNCSIAALA